MDTDAKKKSLEFFHSRVVDALGYKFTPDKELMNTLLDQEILLQDKHGIPFCPCQPIRRQREKAMTIVCPCIPFHRQHFDAMKRCWCGLFVHKDVTDPSLLKQIPLSEVPHGK
ncbi:MAG: ferredoxin-thioredoxin reductase catalytic domain-containing protein [Methylococcaceae bacterium]|nr:ferredoxin-thioredoxin reductase catalytic domain-containing protein [Prolixibacteraceae bacterium]